MHLSGYFEPKGDDMDDDIAYGNELGEDDDEDDDDDFEEDDAAAKGNKKQMQVAATGQKREMDASLKQA